VLHFPQFLRILRQKPSDRYETHQEYILSSKIEKYVASFIFFRIRFFTFFSKKVNLLVLYSRRKVYWHAFFRYLNIRKMFVHDRIIFGNCLHSFTKVALVYWVKVFTMITKKRFCLLRKRMTSIILRIMVLHFFRSLSMTSCMPVCYPFINCLMDVKSQSELIPFI